MATAFTHVRVEKTTLRELERMRTRFLTAEAMGSITLEKDTRDRFSLDKVILRLIRELDLKDKRSRRARAKRKGGKSTNEETPTDQLQSATGDD